MKLLFSEYHGNQTVLKCEELIDEAEDILNDISLTYKRIEDAKADLKNPMYTNWLTGYAEKRKHEIEIHEKTIVRLKERMTKKLQQVINILK